LKKKILAVIVLIVGLILLGININHLDFDNLVDGKYAGIISNILLISAMIISFQHIRKHGE